MLKEYIAILAKARQKYLNAHGIEPHIEDCNRIVVYGSLSNDKKGEPIRTYSRKQLAMFIRQPEKKE
jgi:hypothetical protein